MDITYGHYRVNKYLLSSIGQWPYQTKLKKCLFASFAYIALVSLLVPELLGLINAWGDVDTTIECIPPIIIIFASIILITNCIYNMEKMELMLSKMNEDWRAWTSRSEVAILHTYAKKGKTFSITFAFFIFSTMFVYIVLPILPEFLDLIIPLNETRPKKTLYPTEYYLDVETYFYWILIHGYISSFICTIILVSVDTMFIVFIQHACGELAILGLQLKNFLKKDYGDFNIDKIKLQKEINQEIKFCAQKHRRIIKFINHIHDCFSNSFLLVLGLNMVIMSVTGVQTVMKLGHLHEVMRFGAFTFGQMFHLFYLSIPCQQLMDHSINISNNIYSGHWYQLSSESQKMLLMIMRKSSIPCTFTAGKLYTYSMQNFVSILRTSMSYFTVLSSVR